jgi:hypothetical protein
VQTVLVIESGEFQAQTVTGFYVAHHRFCANLPIIDEKVKLQVSAQVFPNGGFDKDATQVEVPNAGQFLFTIAMPMNVNAVVCLNSRAHPPGIENSLWQAFLLFGAGITLRSGNSSEFEQSASQGKWE